MGRLARSVRLLLDTHVFLWWLDGDRRLSKRARALIREDEAEVYLSAASVWEITTKARLGKLPGAMVVAIDVPRAMASQGLLPLPISVVHAQRAGSLPGTHRDPFDRMLIAQAQIEGLPVVSSDAAFDDFQVTRLW